MISRIIKRVAGLSAFMLAVSVIAFAQSGPIEGNVKVKGEDGKLKPVPDAVVEIHRTDIRGRWEIKTDKQGHFVRLGMPLAATYLLIVSGPGIRPQWVNNVRLTQVPSVEIEVQPGDGSRMTLEEVQAQIAAARKGGSAAQPTISAADRAKLEAAGKDREAKIKESQELQATFDQLRGRFNQGVELAKANNDAAAITEFEAAATVDPTKHAAMAELAYKANASLSEAHYRIGVDLFNQKKKAEAKPHFENAIQSISKSISIASTSTDATASNDLITYYNILAKNALLLVEHFGVADRVDEVMKGLDKAESLDAANKNKWGVYRGNILRFAGRTDEAIASYKKVLAADPNNLDAIYNLGLTLLASQEREQLQESANALADFVSKAPPSDDRVANAKSTVEVLRTQFKIEAEKPAKRRGKP